MQKTDFPIKDIRRKFQELFENSLDIIYVHDLRGNFIDANDVALSKLGYNRDEISDISFKELIDKEQIITAFKALKELKENGKQLTPSEYKLKTKNENYIFVETYGIPLKKNGKIYGILGIAKDITARIIANQKLEKSKERFRELNKKLEQNINEHTQELKRSETNLKERVKELTCLYGLSKLVESQDLSIGEIIQGTLDLIPPAWQFPHNFCSRIVIGGQEFKTDNFMETIWKQIAVIKVKGEKVGTIEIYYLKEMPESENGPFLKEEWNLINAIAEFLGNTYERKKAVEQIKHAYSELDQVFSTSVPMYVIDKNYNIIRLNDSFLSLFHLKREKIIGKKCWDVWKGHLCHTPECTMKQILDGKKSYSYEIDKDIDNGTTISCIVTSFPYYDIEGEIIGSIKNFTDITDRKKSEQRLKESEEKWRSLVENAPSIIMTINREGTILFINRTVPGLSIESVIGKNVRDYTLPEHIDTLTNAIENVFQTGKPKRYEVSGTGPDGAISWYSTKIGPIISEGKVVSAIQITTDITNRKKAEQNLKESEEKYRGIIENIKQGYFEVDLKGSFTFFNDALIEILGYDSDELMGMIYTHYVDEEAAKEIFKVYNNVFKANLGHNIVEFEIIKKNREKVFVETSIYLKKDAEGHRIGFHGLVRDITEKKREATLREKFKEQLEKKVKIRTKELNEALEQQKFYLDQIVRASQFKTEFLTTMSHELRTPLNAIIGFTDILLEGAYGPLNDEQLDFLRDIKSSAEHQFDMIKNILDISKIESGQLHLNFKKFSFNDMIAQVHATIKPLYTKKNLKFEVKGLDNDTFIIADPIRFKEILLNLFSNAVKFTISGSITLIVQDNDIDWIIKVKDTGIGISRKDFDIIFKEFKRVDSPYVASIPGTGLGLSLTKRLVNLHGGEITFSSELRKGTTFTFTIPKYKDKK